MNKLPALILAFFISLPLFTQAVFAQAPGSFLQIEAKTLNKEDFVFPDDMQAKTLNIVLLAIGTERENGTWQGDALVEWYTALDSEGALSKDVMAWHFSVLKVPFFVKGLIRGGMADSYKDKLPLDQAAALFIKDVEGFAKTAGLAVDGQPTIVLVTPDGQLQEIFKGEVSEESLAAVMASVAKYLPEQAELAN
jgi:hypothetical protein